MRCLNLGGAQLLLLFYFTIISMPYAHQQQKFDRHSTLTSGIQYLYGTVPMENILVTLLLGKAEGRSVLRTVAIIYKLIIYFRFYRSWVLDLWTVNRAAFSSNCLTSNALLPVLSSLKRPHCIIFKYWPKHSLRCHTVLLLIFETLLSVVDPVGSRTIWLIVSGSETEFDLSDNKNLLFLQMF